MKMMAQVFTKERQDFEQGLSPILNCMEVIDKREACLNEILKCSQELDLTKSEEELTP